MNTHTIFTFLASWITLNTHSTDNTREELEASGLLESYNLVAITKTWREKSHSWSVAVDGYRLLRKDRLGRSG